LNVYSSDKKETNRSCLSEECRINLQSAVTILRSQADGIIEGNVTIGALKLIQKNEKSFCDIIREIGVDDGTLVRKGIRCI
jgi:hypothetical protein